MRLLLTLFTNFLFMGLLLAQDCDCTAALTHAQALLRTNYAGFPDKVHAATLTAYEAHTAQYAQDAKAVDSLEECFYLLNDWLDWFADPILQLRSPACPCPDTLGYRQLTQRGPFVPLTESQVRASLQSQTPHPLEGIWESSPAGYRVAIVPDTIVGGWQAIVLNSANPSWVPGQVKMRIGPAESPRSHAVDYYLSDHTRQRSRLDLYGKDGQFVLVGINEWQRVFPASSDLYSAYANSAGPFSLYQLPENIWYFDLPRGSRASGETFSNNLKAFHAHFKEGHPWIIDLRNAQWGRSDIYQMLFPYLITESSLNTYHSRFRVSPENIVYLHSRSENRELDRSYRRQLARISKRMGIAPVPFVGPEKASAAEHISTKVGPTQVILLTDNSCKGSCETFVNYASQSDKVTIMGQPTAGSLTYDTGVKRKLDGADLYLYYPIGRSMALPATTPAKPIPPIIPDVLLEAEADWLRRALEMLAEKP